MADEPKQAARLSDPVEHGLGMLGMIGGMLLGAAVGAILVAATVATGGGALALAIAAVGAVGATAGGGLAGGQLMNGLSTIIGLGGVTTGNILPATSPNVLIGMLPAARAQLDAAVCNGLYMLNHFPVPRCAIATGAATVLINGLPAARQSDKLQCASKIEKGEPTVLIGGPTVQVLPIHDAEEALRGFLSTVALVSLLAAAVLLGGGFIAGAICGAVVLEAVATAAVFFVGFEALGELGDKIGPGWRDTLQGGFGIAALVGGGVKGLRSIETGRPVIGEPIDAVTGEVIVQRTDVLLPAALEVVLKRNYASGLTHGSCFGPKWCSTWGQWIEERNGAMAVFFTADGRSIGFDLLAPRDEDGWIRNPLVNKIRLRVVRNGFEVRDEQRRVLRFQEPFADRWLLSAIEDQNGRTIDFAYDAGALRTVTHSGGYTLRVDGSPTRLRRIRLVTPDGSEQELVRYEYDAQGRLAGVIDGTGLPFRYFYDADARLTRWEDREGSWCDYAYDAEGRCVDGVGPAGLFHYQFQYDDHARMNRAIDSYGGVTVFLYNSSLQVIARHDPGGGVTLTDWDDRSNKLREVDPCGRAVTYAYDADGNVLSVESDATGTVRITYDAQGLPTALVDAKGNRWTREYDDRGNLVESALEHAAGWRYERNSSGDVSTVADPSGRTRHLTYDARGLCIAASDWRNRLTRYDRDARGRITKLIDRLGNETAFAYNDLNQMTNAVLADGSRLKWTYNAEGMLTRRVGSDGATYSYRYGPFDLLEQVRKPSGGSLAFSYDLEGRLATVTNERNETYEYVYDQTGHVIVERDFAGREQQYDYDLSGLCIKRVNGVGDVTLLYRDRAGRVAGQQFADGRTTTYEYEEGGRIARAINDAGEITFERDPYDRIVRETQGEHWIESTYDERGLRTSRRTSGGHRVEWSYDDNGFMSAVKPFDDERIEFVRDALGREIERRTRFGFTVRQEFDAVSRLRSQLSGPQTHAWRVGPPLTERRFEYNATGDPAEILDARGINRYTYTADGRIDTVDSDSYLEAFGYDAAGNISWTRLIEGRERPADAHARVHERRVGPGGRVERMADITYAYDDDGRMTEKRQTDERWRFTWTTDGRLQSCITPDGGRWTYEYDAFGRRLRKIGPAGATTYVWDGASIASESSEGTAAIEWVFEPDTFRPICKRTNHDVYVCITDHLGTPRELATSRGELAWAASLTVWGGVRQERQVLTSCPIRFQGQWSDEETGLNYNFYRYYDPESGQYLTPDPIGLSGGTRSYGYVHNPLTWIDPLGLACTDKDLYAFGNKAGPREPRIEGHNLKPGQTPDLVPNEKGLVGPTKPPTGASTFGDPQQAPLGGHYHKLPAGTELPKGVGVSADGAEVGGAQPATHHTIYPTTEMTPAEFVQKHGSLPWEYAGKKP